MSQPNPLAQQAEQTFDKLGEAAMYGWQLRHIFARDRWQCQYCDKPGTKNRTLTLDHIIPESGPTVVANLVTACKHNVPTNRWTLS